MAKSVASILGGFVSLLSSALSLTGDNGVEPLKDTSNLLPQFVSSRIPNDDAFLILPSLALKHGDITASSGSSVEETAALSLARPLALRPMELKAAPMAILASFADSLSLLIDSRLRNSIKALLQQIPRQKDPTLTRVLIGLLACSKSPIEPTSVVTSFQSIPACNLSEQGEVVMPLVMESVVDLKVFGNLVTTTVVAPGTVKATLSSDLLITKAEVVLDTPAFLQSMMKQARFAVRKAVATASSIAANLLIPSSLTFPVKSESALPLKICSSSEDLKAALKGDDSMNGSRLMLPPPSRPSNKQDLAELRKRKVTKEHQRYQEGEKNASWGSPTMTAWEGAVGSGLSLLTAAAGLNNKKLNNIDGQSSCQPISKRQKTCELLQQRKVTSCPRLEEAV